MPAKDTPGEKTYKRLCELTGLKDGTDPQEVLDAHLAQLAEQRAASKLAAALKASAGRPSAPSHNGGGVKLLSREEAEEAVLFGDGLTHHAAKRVTATEDYFGKPLRQALQDGDL